VNDVLEANNYVKMFLFQISLFKRNAFEEITINAMMFIAALRVLYETGKQKLRDKTDDS